MGVLIIVVELLVRLSGRRPFDVCRYTEGFEDLEELLELVEDDEVGLHHAERKPPEALTEILNGCELRLVAEPVAPSPILSPSVVGIYVSIAWHYPYAKLVTDRSWKREDRQENIGRGVEAAIGDTSWPI